MIPFSQLKIDRLEREVDKLKAIIIDMHIIQLNSIYSDQNKIDKKIIEFKRIIYGNRQDTGAK